MNGSPRTVESAPVTDTLKGSARTLPDHEVPADVPVPSSVKVTITMNLSTCSVSSVRLSLARGTISHPSSSLGLSLLATGRVQSRKKKFVEFHALKS